MLNKISTQTAKTRAIPSLHRDNFLAKVPGLCPVLSSGNTTSLYCRAVMLKQLVPRQLVNRDKMPKHNFDEHNSDRLDNIHGFCFATYNVHFDKLFSADPPGLIRKKVLP